MDTTHISVVIASEEYNLQGMFTLFYLLEIEFLWKFETKIPSSPLLDSEAHFLQINRLL